MQAGEGKQQSSDAPELGKVATSPTCGPSIRGVNCVTSYTKQQDMLPIKGVYEIAIRVKVLARAEAFYKDVLGFEEGLRDERRNWLFMWAGGRAGMVVLQEDKGEWPVQHFAFTADEADLARAAELLKAKGVEVSDPVHHEWMNSVSLYFKDPDGHALELIAVK